MPEHHIDIQLVIQELENEYYLGEALLMPEVSRFHDSLKRLEDGLVRSAANIYEELSLLEMHRRHWYGDAEVQEVKVTINPPRHSEVWRNPVPLTFHAVCWHHDSGIHEASIPALNIGVIGRTKEELDKRLPRQISAKLFRLGHTLMLETLVWMQRCQRIHLTKHAVIPKIKNLKQRALELRRPESEKSVLSKVGIDLTKQNLPLAFEMDAFVARLADIVADNRPTSILLVGPSGVGKTAAVYELVRQRKTRNLSKTQFWASSGARIVAGQTGFGMWQERCQQLCKECTEKKIVLFLGNLIELMEVGKSEHNSQGVAAFLRPYIQRGDLQIIVECTPEQLPLIERLDPHLLDQFQQVRLEKPSSIRTKKILRQCTEILEKRLRVQLDAAALDAIIRLHQRFATYSALPGRPVRFLENLMHDHAGKQVITADDVLDAFTNETGLPRFMLDDAVPLDLKATEQWFNQRVRGQTEAVKHVVAQLALTKTELSRPQKPLASLLFIGPTGVGKTELAKVLAEFLFGDPERVVRFDMSEFTDPLAVERLIGGTCGKEGLLTARVREQPFSVLLLDELEKAHLLFFDLLLQVTGEGRLTDRWGRTADFSNTVIIMTSNLGVHIFQKKKPGFGTEAIEADSLKRVEAEVRAFFRPELVNRLDRIVPFYPLDRSTLLGIAQRQLDLIQQRDGVLFRNVDVIIDPDVTAYLAEKDYDPRYGARPLRRRIEREILAPLSQELNRRKSDHTLSARLSLSDNHLKVQVISTGERKTLSPFKMTRSEQNITQISELRRMAQRMLRGQALRTFHNEIFRLKKLSEKAKTRLQQGKSLKPREQQALEKLSNMQQVEEELGQVWQKMCDSEDGTLLTLYESQDLKSFRKPFRSSYAEQAQELSQAWRHAILAFYCLRFAVPDRITVMLYSKNRQTLLQLSQQYYQVFSEQEHDIQLFWLGCKPGEPTILKHHQERVPERFFEQSEHDIVWIGFKLKGWAVYPTYVLENGIHRFPVDNKKQIDCLVHTTNITGDTYLPPENLVRHGEIEHLPVRREYVMGQNILRDRAADKEFIFKGKSFSHALHQAIEASLYEKIRTLLLEGSK